MSLANKLHRKKTLQIEGTNDSSCLSKYSATCQGYFKDDYLQYFIQKQVRRSPLIHIGYCIRSSIINSVIDEFMCKINGQQAQVISFGAGFDTIFFRSVDKSGCSNFTFFEIDLPRVVDKKIKCIQLSDNLKKIIGHYRVSGNILCSKKYYLIAADLRNITVVEQLLMQCGINLFTPTLILSECAITYLEESSSTNLIKWAASFKNSTFVTYEQIHPDDGFGIFMTKHFETVGSPLQSINKYPTLEDQENRYKNNGWSHCHSVSAYDAYTQRIPWEEQFRVLLLEPFDEWEELHLKCAHYTLSISSQGLLSNWIDTSLKKPEKDFKQERKIITWDLIKMNNFNLYGHCLVPADNSKNDELFFVGGFGCEGENAHSRLKFLSRIKKKYDENIFSFFIEVINKDISLETMFATCCKIKSHSTTSFIVYGGRTSPEYCTNTCPLLIEVDCDYKVNCESLLVSCNMQPRWRHSAVIAIQAGMEKLFVFGGRTSQLEVLKDLWKVTLVTKKESRKISIIDDNFNGPCERFSHSAAVWEGSEYDEIFISGGLDKNLKPLSDLWRLDLKTELWSKIATEGMLPRYGHTSHVVDTTLILVGGVNVSDNLQPGIGVLNLSSGICVEYSFPKIHLEMPIILMNHTSLLSEDKSVIQTFGGGGNCFSFGTFFNKWSISIPLNQFKETDI